MKTPRYSRHACVRKQQRAIPEIIVDGLLTYGVRTRSYDDYRIAWTKSAWNQFISEVVGIQLKSAFAKYRYVAAVAAEDDTIITVEWIH